MGKKCTKGKSCGSSCVQGSKRCSVKLGPKQSQELSAVASKIGVVALFEKAKAHDAPGFRSKFEEVRKELREEIGGQIRKPEDVEELKRRMEDKGLLPVGSSKKKKYDEEDEDPDPSEDWDGLTPKEFDRQLESRALKRVGSSDYNSWKDSYSASANEVGAGIMGTVTENPDGTFVKRGIITGDEVKILDKLGGKDISPSLKAANLNGKVNVEGMLTSIKHMDLRSGRIAMSRVPGENLGSIAYYPEEKISGQPAADIYWRAMAQLHRQGVAHNDAHPGNLMVGSKTGKGRWVDFGLSQDNPKAALAEALGAFITDAQANNKRAKSRMPDDANGHIVPGNWQAKEWAITGMPWVEGVRSREDVANLKRDLPVLARVLNNNKKVQKALKEKYGMDNDDIDALYAHGIRSPLETYEQGPWKKLSDSDAQDLIQMFYNGVK